MDYNIFGVKDNAEGQLNANISTLTTLIQLQAGDGANFPTIYTSTTDSLGDSTTLNKTGIGATGIAVGDFIENITDGSHAFVLAVNANSLTTTALQGGTDDTWDNGDEYAVNRFIVTLNARDGSGNITKSEKVLIGARSGDILTADSRGYDGDAAQNFDAADYVNLFVVSRAIQDIGKAFAEVSERLDATASLDYVNTALANRNWKQSVRVATTGAQTLASDFENGDTIDGVVLATGDRVLIKDQAAGAENGIYVVNATGAPTRATDFDEDAEATSAMVTVDEGTVNADAVYLCTDDAPNIGVDVITFVEFGGILAIASQAEAEAGVNNTKYMTPLRTKQAIDYTANVYDGVAGHNITASQSDAKLAFIAYNTAGLTSDAFVTQTSSDSNISWQSQDSNYRLTTKIINDTGYNFRIDEIWLDVDRSNVVGAGPDLTLQLFATDASGLPTGASLWSSSVDPTAFVVAADPAYFTFSTGGINIDNGSTLALLIYSSERAGEWLEVAVDSVGIPTPDLSAISLDSGTTWGGFVTSLKFQALGVPRFTQGRVYLSDDAYSDTTYCDCVVVSNASAGDNVRVQFDGAFNLAGVQAGQYGAMAAAGGVDTWGAYGASKVVKGISSDKAILLHENLPRA